MARRAPADIRMQYNARWSALDASVQAKGLLLQTDAVLEQGAKAGFGLVEAIITSRNSKKVLDLQKMAREFKQFLKKWNRNQKPSRRMDMRDKQMEGWIIQKSGVKFNGKTLRPGANAGVQWVDDSGITRIGRVCAYVYLRAQEDKCRVYILVQERDLLSVLGNHTTVSSAEVRPQQYIDSKQVTHVVWFTPHANGVASQRTCIQLWGAKSVHV
jgi:hypothetical protein